MDFLPWSKLRLKLAVGLVLLYESVQLGGSVGLKFVCVPLAIYCIRELNLPREGTLGTFPSIHRRLGRQVQVSLRASSHYWAGSLCCSATVRMCLLPGSVVILLSSMQQGHWHERALWLIQCFSIQGLFWWKTWGHGLKNFKVISSCVLSHIHKNFAYVSRIQGLESSFCRSCISMYRLWL